MYIKLYKHNNIFESIEGFEWTNTIRRNSKNTALPLLNAKNVLISFVRQRFETFIFRRRYYLFGVSNNERLLTLSSPYGQKDTGYIGKKYEQKERVFYHEKFKDLEFKNEKEETVLGCHDVTDYIDMSSKKIFIPNLKLLPQLCL